jgi:hypothetical protein
VAAALRLPDVVVLLEGGAVDRHDVPPVVGIGDLAEPEEAALICEGRLIIQIQSLYLCLLSNSFKETVNLTYVPKAPLKGEDRKKQLNCKPPQKVYNSLRNHRPAATASGEASLDTALILLSFSCSIGAYIDLPGKCHSI